MNVGEICSQKEIENDLNNEKSLLERTKIRKSTYDRDMTTFYISNVELKVFEQTISKTLQ